MTQPFRIAAITTSFFPNSHAGVLVPKFIRGFPTDDGLIAPRTRIASLYIDQIHESDIGLQIAHEREIPVYESIRAALTLGGPGLAIDAVLLIGEHGDYPRSLLGQEMLPRRYLFEQICGTIAEFGRPVPVFNDKFLSYRWNDAQWMYETARALNIPLWAGSSIPVCWRRPHWDHPLDTPIDEALTLGFHMLERYGYHALEALQCQVERRLGGETGVRSVQCLSGDAVWRAGEKGLWSRELADRALVAVEGHADPLDPTKVEDPYVFLLEYADGLKASVLMLGDNGYLQKFAYAGKCGSDISALGYHTDGGEAHATFSYLGLNIEDFFLNRTPPTPVERTYLTTGVLEAVMRSHGAGGQHLETPHLAIGYTPADDPPRRPQAERPTGACLNPWPHPEPGATPTATRIPSGRDGTIRPRH